MSFTEDPFDVGLLGDDEDDEDYERFCREWDEKKERFNPADWVNGHIDHESLDDEEFRTYKNWFVEKVLDNDGQFPPELDEKQRTWPADCPLSEEELRGEITDMLRKVKAITERIGDLIERLPEPSESYEVAPPGIYYELLSCLQNSPEHLEEAVFCLERSLAHTPETLRTEWLEREKRLRTPQTPTPLARRPPFDGFWPHG